MYPTTTVKSEVYIEIPANSLYPEGYAFYVYKDGSINAIPVRSLDTYLAIQGLKFLTVRPQGEWGTDQWGRVSWFKFTKFEDMVNDSVIASHISGYYGKDNKGNYNYNQIFVESLTDKLNSLPSNKERYYLLKMVGVFRAYENSIEALRMVYGIDILSAPIPDLSSLETPLDIQNIALVEGAKWRNEINQALSELGFPKPVDRGDELDMFNSVLWEAMQQGVTLDQIGTPECFLLMADIAKQKKFIMSQPRELGWTKLYKQHAALAELTGKLIIATIATKLIVGVTTEIIGAVGDIAIETGTPVDELVNPAIDAGVQSLPTGVQSLAANIFGSPDIKDFIANAANVVVDEGGTQATYSPETAPQQGAQETVQPPKKGLIVPAIAASVAGVLLGLIAYLALRKD